MGDEHVEKGELEATKENQAKYYLKMLIANRKPSLLSRISHFKIVNVVLGFSYESDWI